MDANDLKLKLVIFAALVGGGLWGCAQNGSNLAAVPDLKQMTGGRKATKTSSWDWEFKREGRGPNDPACVKKALTALRAHSPSGSDTYNRLDDKDAFASFIAGCADLDDFYLSDVPTAVHESVHAVRAETEAYHLVSNELLPVPSAPGYFPPREISATLARELKETDDYFKAYIRPGGEPASSKDDFTYLLDEFNAYTNDLQAMMDLSALATSINREPGVVAMMTFVAKYVSFAQANHPDTFKHLGNDKQMQTTLKILWDQADHVLNKSCTYRANTDFDDSKYLNYLCDAGKTQALAAVLGHSVRCPAECRSGSMAI